FRRRGHSAWVVTSHMEGEAKDEPFVHRVGTSRVILSNGSFARVTTGLGIGRELQRFFRAQAIDVVNVHGALAPTLGLIAPTTSPRLLFLGRLDPRNGLEVVLDAMPAILLRYPTAELTVVGDGPLRGFYEQRARSLGDRVRFVGRIYAERPEYYGTADLYLCP